ncbi:Uu.00g034750.m01.CDS01 [Anthostomella pinea]|uniref:Uu.00g034750.m01.CDS01 n=1 Tax=Anthostomella pinea TaxID=933095 RepID=A0AAI8V9Q9_9PEZI|nr:Uu.00g034750.m01.CDS01 [Anthostomella pinea]
METSLRKQNYMPISERDLHHLLAEAIVAGQGNDSVEISTGLQEADPSASVKPIWFNNPRFSHLISHGSVMQSTSKGTGPEASLKQKLASASGHSDACQQLEQAFTVYLGALLKLPVETITAEDPIIDLGIDSLVAVEIRGWLAAEAGHDIPVLKILSGASIQQLCSEACSKMSFQEDVPSASAPAATPAGPTVATTDSSSTSPSGSITSRRQSVGSPDTLSSSGTYTPPERPEKPLPLRTHAASFGQTRLYFASQYLDDASPFNCTTSYTLSGRIGVARFEASIASVMRPHEGFRTMFSTDSLTGTARQGILDELDLRLPPYHHGWRELAAVPARLGQVLQQPAVFGPPPPPPPAQPADFALKQEADLTAGEYDERLKYWQDQFPHVPEPMPLFPFSKVSARKPLTSYEMREVVSYVDAGLVVQIKKAAQASRTTSFHFWLATFQAMLSRFLDIEDLCIGIVDANRSDPAFSNTIGFLLEILPVLFRVKGNHQFKQVLTATRAKLRGVDTYGCAL